MIIDESLEEKLCQFLIIIIIFDQSIHIMIWCIVPLVVKGMESFETTFWLQDEKDDQMNCHIYKSKDQLIEFFSYTGMITCHLHTDL